MARKPILSAGIAMVSAAAIIAAGPSLFAPRSGRVEAAPGTKALDSVHIGYRMTGISDISLGGFLDALQSGYSGTVIEDVPDYPTNVESGNNNLTAAAFYLVDKALGSGVEADDYYFKYGVLAGLQVAFEDSTGGPGTPWAEAAEAVLYPIDTALSAIDSVFGAGTSDYVVYPGLIPITAAYLVNPDLGDIVYTLILGDDTTGKGALAASALAVTRVLGQLKVTTGVDILSTPVGNVVNVLAKLGGAKATTSTASGDDAQEGEDGQGTEPLSRTPVADAVERSALAQQVAREVSPLTAARTQTGTYARSTLASEDPEATEPAAVAELGAPGVPVLGKAKALVADDVNVVAPPVAAKQELSTPAVVPAAADTGAPAAKKDADQPKKPGAKLGQQLKKTTDRINDGLKKAGQKLSNAIGGANKATDNKDTANKTTNKTEKKAAPKHDSGE